MIEEVYMASIQPNAHSFVIKVWLAGPEDGSAGGEVSQRGDWRGRITHVPSGQSCHFTRLSDITQFVMPYLHGLGVRPSRWWRLNQWWRKQRHSRL